MSMTEFFAGFVTGVIVGLQAALGWSSRIIKS